VLGCYPPPRPRGGRLRPAARSPPRHAKGEGLAADQGDPSQVKSELASRWGGRRLEQHHPADRLRVGWVPQAIEDDLGVMASCPIFGSKPAS